MDIGANGSTGFGEHRSDGSVDPALVVELAFAVRGQNVALDHGYLLYAAVSELVPGLHAGTLSWQLLPVRGRQSGPGRLTILPSTRLCIRCPVAEVAQALALAGKTLRVGQDLLAVGVATIQALRPAPNLVSRFVTIKGFVEPEPMAEAVGRQLVALLGSDHGAQAQIGARRVLRVADKAVVGFQVAVGNLDDRASLLLQANGIGGRRRMGAGVFLKAGRKG